MAEATKLDLEGTFAEIRAIIDSIEHEKSSLQDSVNAFEYGIKLTREAQQILSDAEHKVNALIISDGEIESRDFIEKSDE